MRTRLSSVGSSDARRGVLVLASIVAAGAAAGGAHGAVIDLYDDRDAFERLLVDAVLEDFEDEALGALAPPSTFAGSGLVADLLGDGWTLAVTDSTTFSFNTTDGGQNHLRSAFGSGTWTLVLQTPEPVTAFGFSITGYQDLTETGGLDVALFAGGDAVEAFSAPDPGNFDESFHGIFSDTAFDEVRITVAGDDFAGVDDVVFAAIPAPAAGLLLAGPLLAGRRRRRG